METVVILVVVVLAVFTALGGLFWLSACAIDRGIKDYIDYAKERKDQ